MHVVLFEPEIPGNTGNIIRLCANTGEGTFTGPNGQTRTREMEVSTESNTVTKTSTTTNPNGKTETHTSTHVIQGGK